MGSWHREVFMVYGATPGLLYSEAGRRRQETVIEVWFCPRRLHKKQQMDTINGVYQVYMIFIDFSSPFFRAT